MSIENIDLIVNNVQYARQHDTDWLDSMTRVVVGYVRNGTDDKNYWYNSRIELTIPDAVTNKEIESIVVKTALSGASLVSGTTACLSADSISPCDIPANVTALSISGPLVLSSDIYNPLPNSTYSPCPDGLTSNGSHFKIKNPDIYFKFTLPDNQPFSPGDKYYVYFYSDPEVGDNYTSRTAFHGSTSMSKYGAIVECLSTYTVTYDDGIGNNAWGSQIKTHSKDLIIPSSVPIHTGHSFRCWKNEVTGAEYSPGTAITDNTNMALVAQWSKNYIEIIYTSGGGRIQRPGCGLPMPYRDKAYYDTGYDLHKVSDFWLNRDGFHLTDENTDKVYWTDGDDHLLEQGTQMSSGQELANHFGVSIDSGNQTITICPNWIANYATIRFESNGATVGANSIPFTAKYDIPYLGMVNRIEKMGLKKTGYHIEPGKEWVTTDGKVVPETSSTIDSSAFLSTYFGKALAHEYGTEYKLYANWVPNKLTIRYVMSDGEEQDDGALQLPMDVQVQYDMPLNYGFGVHGAYHSFRLTKTGYHLTADADWVCEETGKTLSTYTASILGQDIASLLGYDLSLNDYQGEVATLRANWSPNVLNIKYDIRPSEKQSSDIGDDLTLPLSVDVRYDDEINIYKADSDLQLTREGYHLKEDQEWVAYSNGVDIALDQDKTYATSNDFAEAVGASTFKWSPLTRVVLRAGWEPNVYTISYKNMEETVCSVSIEHGNSHTICEDIPERTGFRFMGWMEVDSGSHYLPGDTIVVTSPLNLTAIWSKILNVTFYAQTASCTPEDHSNVVEISTIEVVAREDFRDSIPTISGEYRNFVVGRWSTYARFIVQDEMVADTAVDVVKLCRGSNKWATQPYYDDGYQTEVDITSSGVEEDTEYYLLYKCNNVLTGMTFPEYEGVRGWKWLSEQRDDTYLPTKVIPNIVISADPEFEGITDPNYPLDTPPKLYVRTANGITDGVPYVKVRNGDGYTYVQGSDVYVKVGNQWVLGGT